MKGSKYLLNTTNNLWNHSIQSSITFIIFIILKKYDIMSLITHQSDDTLICKLWVDRLTTII